MRLFSSQVLSDTDQILCSGIIPLSLSFIFPSLHLFLSTYMSLALPRLPHRKNIYEHAL